jgi:hypothetical protein
MAAYNPLLHFYHILRNYDMPNWENFKIDSIESSMAIFLWVDIHLFLITIKVRGD